MRIQQCDKCGMNKPLTASFFDKKVDAGSGFRTTCKTCRKHERMEQTEITTPKAGNMEQLLASGDLALVNKFGEMMTLGAAGGTSVPHIAEVYESVMSAFGGPAGYAAQIVATYLAASPGSQVRQRVLTMIAKMAGDATESGKATIRLDLLTDEELDAVVKDRMMTAIRQRPGDIVKLLEEIQPTRAR